jgi:FAD/FMN-containing dehydrogenase
MGNTPLQEHGHLTGLSNIVSQLQGDVYLPDDPRYENARKAWNLVVDQHPRLVFMVENAQDVSAALNFARQNGLKVTVQCTGHGLVRPAEGALLILTARMQTLEIDAHTQTAWIGAGLKWGQVLEQTQPHGLAPLLGSSPDVGAVGYSLGGGMGWLARKYGLSSDSILQLEVVTPDGVVRRAGPLENQDLFWALRGGGGGFGVVTAMQVRLFPVAQVYAGNLYYSPEKAPEVYRHFREWAANVPDELTASIALMNFPPFPDLPDPIRGKSFAILRGCYCGPVDRGPELLEYWRAWHTPALDDFKAMPFSECASISQDPLDPIPVVSTGAWMDELSDHAADQLTRFTLPQDGPPPLISTEVRLAGGALARASSNSGAYSHRAEQWIWFSAGLADRPQEVDRIKGHFEHMRTALGPALNGRVYMNFIDGEEAWQRTQAGFSQEHFQRLQAVKTRYDPESRLISGFNIPPL